MAALPDDRPSAFALREELDAKNEPIRYIAYDQAAKRALYGIFFWLTGEPRAEITSDKQLMDTYGHDGLIPLAEKIIDLIHEEEDQSIPLFGRQVTNQVSWYLHADAERLSSVIREKPTLRLEVIMLLAKAIDLHFLEESQQSQDSYPQPGPLTCPHNCEWCEREWGLPWDDPKKTMGQFCSREECERYLFFPGKLKEFRNVELHGTPDTALL